MVYNYTETEQIRLIMQEAPTAWTPIVQPQFCKMMVELQNTIVYHEENLVDTSANYIRARNEGNNSSRASFQPPYQRARENLVGWSKDMPAPEFAKDNQTVLNKTPELIGARPCRHCGSGKHWDKECKHAKQGERKA
ncbi:hypothetical protein FIBSPDRAFT_726587 [Athelia psychrophila]|uniref:Uncharacterized protein n=1 Tax=Athelia psychrophila TaxID=1759441 RepID=A0A166SZF0_9AGAM|nr:hypothetical protein FIBSPDRAFT_726587 [Fibularhizoctonia sp. CBS 109695]